jgi:hypothetical protein
MGSDAGVESVYKKYSAAPDAKTPRRVAAKVAEVINLSFRIDVFHLCFGSVLIVVSGANDDGRHSGSGVLAAEAQGADGG